MKEKYLEILAVLEKYQGLGFSDAITRAKAKLWEIELSEDYGILLLNEVYRSDLCHPQEYLFIGWWGEKHNRSISWEDNGNQPENELLMQIGFPTGGYIFGEEYHDDVFKEFFLELKSYNYKYIDTVNRALYFTMDTAGKISHDFQSIYKKYWEKYRSQEKDRKIKKLQKEIDYLNK
jgi:hypothetical protein